MIVFETIFASLYGYLWEGRWPTGLEALALVLLVAGVILCARAHRSDAPVQEHGPNEVEARA
jgi:drug/metabolite transporter (DMT)-like permease